MAGKPLKLLLSEREMQEALTRLPAPLASG
jgi:hypothetical protein